MYGTATMFISLFVLAGAARARDDLQLQSVDGLPVSADIYRAVAKPDAPWIILAHQAGSSRGEYREIAPRLNQLGFNAIAIDQRSGKAFAGVRNGTAQKAAARGVDQSYRSADKDIEAAIAWARKETSGPVLLWGSSYSAALALWLAGTQPALVDGVIAMSPGEYLSGLSVIRNASEIKVPIFIASDPSERETWSQIFKTIGDRRKVAFVPRSGGAHGSSAFIQTRNKSSSEYWTALEAFLARQWPNKK